MHRPFDPDLPRTLTFERDEPLDEDMSATATARKPAASTAAVGNVGADAIVHRPGLRTAPGGLTHLVEGWHPVCGGDRVRFVFPNRSLDEVGEVCDDCRAAVARKAPRRRASSA